MKRMTIAAFAGLMSLSAASAADIFDGRIDQYADQPTRIYFQGLAVGVDVGGQFGSAQINYGGDSFDGIAHDGGIAGAHVEYLFPIERFRIGAYGNGGFSNANTTYNDFDLLNQKSYFGGGLKAGGMVGDSTLISVHFGYDRSQWEAFEAVDAEVDSWVIGAAIETMASENFSLGLDMDYLLVNDVEAAGADLSEIFEDSEMIRVKARLTWRQ